MLHATRTDSKASDELHAPPSDCDPKIREAFAYWCRIQPSQGLPGRQHFDPTDVPQLLGCTRLLDIVGQPPMFKVRLIGTKFAERLGYDITGRFLDEVFEGFDGSNFQRRLVDTIKSRKPIWSRGPIRWFCQESYRNVERIHFPLARDGATIDMIWSVTCYQE
jgi:hypothetical protein